MQKIFALALIAAITLSACKKENPPTPGPHIIGTLPASTFNITFNGKTYHLFYDETLQTVVSAKITSDTPALHWNAIMNAQNVHMRCIFSGRKHDSTGSAIGVYKSGNEVGGGSNFLQLVDYDDGGKFYTSGMDGKDTTSTITVTVATAKQVKGTFNIILSHNGISYPATGDFDYQN